MVLYPPSRSTDEEKLPEESAVIICSPDSEVIATDALGKVLPETVTEFWLVSDSSSGDVSVSVTEEDGVGEREVTGTGDGVGVVWGSCLRDLLAVQIPKVMISPNMKPILMARNTSFFMVGLEINNRSWYCQECGNYLSGTREL